jgi:hypothetical protein
MFTTTSACSASSFGIEALRAAGGEVNAELTHDLDDLRVDLPVGVGSAAG